MIRNEDKFNDWWRQLEPSINRHISRLVGSESRDILQDVSVMAILRFDEFANFEDFRRWAFKRAWWLALDELTRRRRFAADSEEIIQATPDMQKESALVDVLPLVARLPTQQREISLDLLQGYTANEVGEKHGISVATVRSLWRHAKNKLSNAFENDYE